MEIWRARGPRKAAFLITPFVALVLVYFLPSAEAGVAQMSRAPLPPEMKDLFIAYQFNQTLSESLRIMAWKFTYNFPSFLMAAVFFGFPAAVSVIAAGLTFKSKRDSLAVALATLAPASILIVGWDLSRFLVATAFANMLCILFMRTLRPAAPPSRSEAVAGLVPGAGERVERWATIVMFRGHRRDIGHGNVADRALHDEGDPPALPGRQQKIDISGGVPRLSIDETLGPAAPRHTYVYMLIAVRPNMPFRG